MSAPEGLSLRGRLIGHNGWVTAIAAPSDPNAPDVVISSSRDKSIIVWSLVRQSPEANSFGFAQKRLTGHAHFVQDVTVTPDGHYILSGSWDGTLRLWDLQKDKSTRFVGHTKDVLTVAFSEDNRQIVSGSRDKTIKLWNAIGKCKYTFGPNENGHKEWVSCVRFSPSSNPNMAPLLVSAGWDKIVKVFTISNCKLRTNLVGHTSYINSVAIAPDGSLCASGGKDGSAMLWDLNEGKHLSILDAADPINALVFSPSRYWLCAATTSRIVIWDLETKFKVDEIALSKEELPEKKPDSKALPIQCISLCWSADGNILFAGYTDNIIRCYHITRQ